MSALEATGIYSTPVYHALIEHAEFGQVLVCKAGHVKNVPAANRSPLRQLLVEIVGQEPEPPVGVRGAPPGSRAGRV